jgi:hypothetical protein
MYFLPSLFAEQKEERPEQSVAFLLDGGTRAAADSEVTYSKYISPSAFS